MGRMRHLGVTVWMFAALGVAFGLIAILGYIHHAAVNAILGTFLAFAFITMAITAGVIELDRRRIEEEAAARRERDRAQFNRNMELARARIQNDFAHALDARNYVNVGNVALVDAQQSPSGLIAMEKFLAEPPRCGQHINDSMLGVAEFRALGLLKDSLTLEQREQWDKWSAFRVDGSEHGRYWIIRSHDYNVYSNTHRFCAYPAGRWQGTFCHGLPLHDSLLAQKLLIETNERAYLNVANIGWLP